MELASRNSSFQLCRLFLLSLSIVLFKFEKSSFLTLHLHFFREILINELIIYDGMLAEYYSLLHLFIQYQNEWLRIIVIPILQTSSIILEMVHKIEEKVM